MALRRASLRVAGFHTSWVAKKVPGLASSVPVICKAKVTSTTLISHRSFHPTSVVGLPKTVPFILSDIGEGIVEVLVKEWYVKPGDKVNQFDPVCEVQSDKASVTISSRYDGTIGKLYYEVDAVAKVGSALLDIIVPEEIGKETATPIVQEPPKIILTGSILPQEEEEDIYLTNKSLATPAVRRIARENKINLSEVPGTGKDARVMKEDILLFIQNKSSSPGTSSAAATGIPSATGIAQSSPAAALPVSAPITVELTGIRKAMSQTMTNAWKIPHFSYTEEIDVTDLIALRKAVKLDVSAGVKVTYLPFLLKAVSLALLKHPQLNAHMNAEGTTHIIHSEHNLGVAVDSPLGLVVPNVKQVQNLSVVEIAKELHRLQQAARQGRLTMQDLSDGTLTVSNIGNIGGVQAQPILLPPQVAIAAVGKIQKLPRYDANDNLIPRSLMMMTWSADHRALDGASVARFSNLVKELLASPKLLLQL